MAVRLPVDPNEDLDSLINNLKAQTSKEVVLVLPPETRALQTLDNFYALRTAVRNSNIALSISGGNKTIRGLAKLLGFSVNADGAAEEDTGASDTFGNVATSQAAGSGGRAPYGMPEGYSVAQPTIPLGGMNRPPENVPTPRQSAQDFLNEMRDFNPGFATTPLQPPPVARNESGPGGGGGGGNMPNGFVRPGDQVLTRENIPDFFDSADGGGRRATPPPPPQADFNLGDNRTISIEEAMRSGYLGGSGGPGGTDPAFNSGPLDDYNPLEDDIPVIASEGDTAADRFRSRGGVRNADDTGGRAPRRGRAPKPRRDNRVAAATAAGTLVSDNAVLTRVRRLLVPVQPRAAGSGIMVKPVQSPEDIRKRNAQRRSTTMVTLASIGMIALLFGLLLIWLLGQSGGGQAGPGLPPSISLTVPLKTQEQEQTVRIQLVTGVQGLAQANPTAPLTSAPVSGTTGTAPAAPTPPGPAVLPVETVKTDELKRTGERVPTGTRNVPDKPASGPVTIFNGGYSSKSYGAGTVMYTAPNGVAYRLVQGVTVGSGNPAASRSATASGQVVADKAGPQGNLDKPVQRSLGDAVGMQLGPVAGGTERSEKFVTQADLDELKVQLQDQARSEANNLLKFNPDTQAALVLKSTEPVCSFSKKVNDAVDANTKLTGTCTMSLEAVIYNKEAVTRAVSGQFVTDPANYVLDDKTRMTLSEPKFIEEKGQRFIEVKAKGRIVPRFNETAFKEAIANKPKAEVPAIIARDFPNVAAGQMSLEGVNVDVLPLSNKIDVKTVLDYEAVSQPTPGGLPSGTNQLPKLPGGGVTPVASPKP